MSSSSTPSDLPAGRPSNRPPVETLQSLVAGRPSPFVRIVGLGVVLAGVAHLLGPRALLWTVRVGYGRVLDVDFDPGENTTRRVRILGLAMVAAGAHLTYHGAVIPAEHDG